MTNNLSPHDRRVFVWDLPTRIFHWGLLVLIVVDWITSKEEGQAAAIHRYAGTI